METEEEKTADSRKKDGRGLDGEQGGKSSRQRKKKCKGRIRQMRKRWRGRRKP